ncbi:TA system antitoxin ParD family protein [Azotosporobacter soli]|uniref:TA system antitoxin ParD family protein n=1 Tax=Azotosporobacter soli TaxID=3055040 RepID=UPI0031FF24F3
MSIPIRVDNALYEEAKECAAAEFRTVPLQIAYWAKIGKAALDNPDLPIEFIRDVLIGKTQKSEPFEFVE